MIKRILPRNIACLGAVLVWLSFTSCPTFANEIELSDDDVMFMKQLMNKDALIRSLPKAQNGLAALNKILSIAPLGPVKLALQWNQGAIKTWRVANSKLEAIAKASICDEIDLRIAEEGPNTAFYEQLYEARGCKQ